jgi:hypothetical protein
LGHELVQHHRRRGLQVRHRGHVDQQHPDCWLGTDGERAHPVDHLPRVGEVQPAFGLEDQ